eukprot:m.32742 g.32742  ORF g.32742 m.32742 type:complete len:535 (-) comp16689_c0_seq3:177-1781(-)
MMSRMLKPQLTRPLVRILSRALASSSSVASKKVNDIYQPGLPRTMLATPVEKFGHTKACDTCICSTTDEDAEIKRILADHQDDQWSSERVKDAFNSHGLMTWGAHDAMSPSAIQVERAEGIYFFDTTGKRYIDFNSMAMCSNMGHTVHPSIIKAVTDQLESMAYMYPGVSVSAHRARLGKLLADIVPGDINTFMFPSSGTEANEAAIRIARRYTGRHKIFSGHRSYHGHTLGALAATGDFRRWAADGQLGDGYVKFFGPYPYAFRVGVTEEEITMNSLTQLEEQLKAENPKNVAAILLECIPGTNGGVLVPPKGYIEGIRALCDKYGIMMIADEVMTGFGRTGKLFSYCHAENVQPDLITFAKGVNGAYLPMSGLGMRDKIAEFFRKNTSMVGSTYHSHPAALASGYAAIKVQLEQGLVKNAARMQPVMEECMNELLAKHPCVKQARCIGLFGAFDIQKNVQGEFIGEVQDPLPPVMAAFKNDLLNRGLFTMMRGHTVFTNPPLIITEEQIRESFAIISESLKIIDAEFEAGTL